MQWRLIAVLGSIPPFLVAIVAGIVYLWVGTVFDKPGPLKKDTTLVIPYGTSVKKIGKMLEDERVVSSGRIFALGVKLYEQRNVLKAGEYRFKSAISMRKAMNQVMEGKTFLRSLVVPEGFSSNQVVRLLSNIESLKGDITEIPKEGALLPETYFFSRGDRRSEIIERMRRSAEQTVENLWAERAKNLPFSTPYEAVILASIVEKETALAAERARIAGVFVNRLNKKMRLPSDPTVVYSITLGQWPLKRKLTRGDLKINSPFNTYRFQGLPPTPICNPGKESIIAVLRPIETKDIYFVANGSGGHAFARTLVEHRINVKRWRKILRDGKASKITN